MNSRWSSRDQLTGNEGTTYGHRGIKRRATTARNAGIECPIFPNYFGQPIRGYSCRQLLIAKEPFFFARKRDFRRYFRLKWHFHDTSMILFTENREKYHSEYTVNNQLFIPYFRHTMTHWHFFLQKKRLRIGSTGVQISNDIRNYIMLTLLKDRPI